PPAHHCLHPFPTRRSSDLLEIPAGAVEDAARRKQYLIDVTSEACSTFRQLRVDRCIPAGIQARELELLSAALLLGDDHQLSVSPDRKSTRLNSSHVKISYA